MVPPALQLLVSEVISTEFSGSNFQQKLLKEKYGCTDIPLEYWEDLTPKLKRYNNAVRTRIQEKLTGSWKEGMNSKPSLSLYKEHKERGVTAPGLYNNNRGSALMALARAGMLPTRTHKAKYQSIDPICQKCGREAETIPHIIMKCEPQAEPEEIARRLGLTEGGHGGTWRETRQTLVTWENETHRRSAE